MPSLFRRKNAELVADRPIEVSFLPRGTALEDADLIRTKVSLIPESVPEIRVVQPHALTSDEICAPTFS